MNEGVAIQFSDRDDFFQFFLGLARENTQQIFQPYHGELVLVSHDEVITRHDFSMPRKHFYLGVVSVDPVQTVDLSGIPTTCYVDGCNGEYFLRQGHMIPRDSYLVGGEPIQLSLDLEGNWYLIVGNDMVRQWLAIQRNVPYITKDLLRILSQ
ncbi:MAG: hypothetical protein WAU28_04230 [Candidatus Moraniibacteriota bacterium]